MSDLGGSKAYLPPPGVREPRVEPEQLVTAPIDERGRFLLSDLRLRRVAGNTFLLAIESPPNAPRFVLFSALCLDRIISGSSTPPS